MRLVRSIRSIFLRIFASRPPAPSRTSLPSARERVIFLPCSGFSVFSQSGDCGVFFSPMSSLQVEIALATAPRSLDAWGCGSTRQIDRDLTQKAAESPGGTPRPSRRCGGKLFALALFLLVAFLLAGLAGLGERGLQLGERRPAVVVGVDV